VPANIDDHPLNRISSDLPRRGGPNIQVTLALIVALVGVVLLVAGYLGVSGTTVTSDQLSYLASSTLPGIAVLVAGAVLLARAAALAHQRSTEALNRQVESLVAWLSDASNDAESPTDPGE
jgi:drug/metabolite transporter (DMT)-like permease